MQKTINSTEFRKMVASGARMLEINRAKVDALNVFPVPDGDTGTNMSLTLQSAVKEMNACSSNRFQEICDAVSKGALRGARGNSGVISSQIFRGLCSVLRYKDVCKSSRSGHQGCVQRRVHTKGGHHPYRRKAYERVGFQACGQE